MSSTPQFPRRSEDVTNLTDAQLLEEFSDLPAAEKQALETEARTISANGDLTFEQALADLMAERRASGPN